MDYRRRRLEERISHQIVLALLTLLTVIVQVNLLPMVLRASLNLVLIAVVAWTMVRDVNTGAAVAFYGGLALDLLAGTPIGSHILPLLLVAGLTTVVIERFPAAGRRRHADLPSDRDDLFGRRQQLAGLGGRRAAAGPGGQPDPGAARISGVAVVE
jgi:hypothetical protein